MLQLNIGQTYYSKYYADRIEVVIKAIFDDRVVYHNRSKDRGQEFEVISVELFNDSYVASFIDLKIKRLNKQIEVCLRDISRQQLIIEQYKTELAELEAKNV